MQLIFLLNHKFASLSTDSEKIVPRSRRFSQTFLCETGFQEDKRGRRLEECWSCEEKIALGVGFTPGGDCRGKRTADLHCTPCVSLNTAAEETEAELEYGRSKKRSM